MTFIIKFNSRRPGRPKRQHVARSLRTTTLCVFCKGRRGIPCLTCNGRGRVEL